jgi:hypothetical protein
MERLAAEDFVRRPRVGYAATTPAFSSVLARLAQLAILATLSHLHLGGSSAAVAGFGLVTSFAILSDSGFGVYMLSTFSGAVPTMSYRRGLRYHAGLGITGAVAAVAGTYAVNRSATSGEVIVLVAALALTQVADSTSRTARMPYLALGRPVHFALAELGSTASKIPLIAVSIATGSPNALFGLPVVAMGVCAISIYTSRDHVSTKSIAGDKVGIRTLWPYTASTTVSALYSQAPIVIAGLILGSNGLARLTLVYRTVQPPEILASTVSQQITTGLRSASHARVTTIWLAFGAGGAVVWGAIVGATPLIDSIYDVQHSLFLLLFTAGAGVPVKFGNYALVAALVAKGGIQRRLRASLLTGIVATALAGLAAFAAGAEGVLVAVVGSELVLCALLRRALRPTSGLPPQTARSGTA